MLITSPEFCFYSTPLGGMKEPVEMREQYLKRIITPNGEDKQGR